MIIKLVKLRIIKLGTLFKILNIFNSCNYKFLAFVSSCNCLCILAVFNKQILLLLLLLFLRR